MGSQWLVRMCWDPAALQQKGPRAPRQPAAPAAPGPQAFLGATWVVTSVTKNPRARCPVP